MNDLSELENDLRALRPARPSPVLFERIEEAMAENASVGRVRRRMELAAFHGMEPWQREDGRSLERTRRPTQTPFRFGIGLAAAVAAVVLLLARINTDQTRNEDKEDRHKLRLHREDKSGPPCLLGWERCRWIDVVQQIRSRWRDAGRL